MIDQEKILKYLNDRISALDKFIGEHRKRIMECAPNDSNTMRIHMESIGKLQARKNECETLIQTITSFKK